MKFYDVLFLLCLIGVMGQSESNPPEPPGAARIDKLISVSLLAVCPLATIGQPTAQGPSAAP